MSEDTKKTRLTLLERIKNTEDQAAWYEFHQFYWKLIIGWAKMNGCSDALAKDVFQESMVNLVKKISSFEYDLQKGHFRSFLKTIVTRRVKDAFRREGRYIAEGQDRSDEDRLECSKLENIPDLSSADDIAMDKIWVETALSQALKRTFAKVDPLTYKSFCLHVLDELPVDEVAKKLGISRERNIYEHKRRVMEILKREFKAVIEEQDGPDTGAIDEVSLKKALEELLEGESEQRMTMKIDSQPINMFEQITYLREKLKNFSEPENEAAFLVSLNEKTENVVLKGKMILGRDHGNEIVLDRDGVSGRHASIFNTDRGWVIKDENSTNGIFINGSKIEGESFLKNGDIIQITSEFQFVFYQS